MTTRVGPVRAVVARDGAGWSAREVLECGHEWLATFVRGDGDHSPGRARRRRCVFCPESPRAEYFRTYKRRQRGTHAAA